MEIVKLIIVILICLFLCGVAFNQIYTSKYKKNVFVYLLALVIIIGSGFVYYQMDYYRKLPYKNYNDDEHKNH